VSNRIFWGAPSGAFVAPDPDDGRHRFPGRLGIGEEGQGLQDDPAMTVFVYVNTSKQVGDKGTPKDLCERESRRDMASGEWPGRRGVPVWGGVKTGAYAPPFRAGRSDVLTYGANWDRRSKPSRPKRRPRALRSPRKRTWSSSATGPVRRLFVPFRPLRWGGWDCQAVWTNPARVRRWSFGAVLLPCVNLPMVTHHIPKVLARRGAFQTGCKAALDTRAFWRWWRGSGSWRRSTVTSFGNSIPSARIPIGGSGSSRGTNHDRLDLRRKQGWWPRSPEGLWSQDAAQNSSRKTILKELPSSMQFRPTAQKIALWEPDVRRLLVE